MNYRHPYHAGNFADVFKHLLLYALLEHLIRKNKPLSYMETHAGIGEYDLYSIAAQKTCEFKGGIHKLWKTAETSTPPLLIQRYLNLVLAWNQQHCPLDSANLEDHLRYYPGSPQIARQLMRPADQMILCELHPRDHQVLKKIFAADSQVAVHHQDGYSGLKAFLPPRHGRGLVLIDPPFEHPDEWQRLTEAGLMAIKRWETGIFAFWYPLTEIDKVERFYQEYKKEVKNLVRCELSLSFALTGLNACGMAVVNPPWQWEENIKSSLSWLAKILSEPGFGEYLVESW